MLKTALSALVLALSVTASALAQSTVFLIRHAERADAGPGKAPTMSADPDLSKTGHARAASLATVLKDAGITAIYVTEYRRTQQTAAPLAKALGLTPSTIKSDDASAVMAAIKGTTGNVLVVGHSNTLPAIIKGLGVSSTVTIGDDEFDNLFVVRTGADPALIRLHYR
jgi:phosphohistidine phosphatase SixA